MLRAHQREQFLDVDEADGVIEILATQRKPRVPGFNCLFHIGFETVFQIEVNDFSARRHDVAHYAVTQIQYIKDKLATKSRDLGGFFALLNDQSQFFLAMSQFSLSDGFHTNQATQHPVARSVQKPDRWFKDCVKPSQWRTHKERSSHRLSDGENLGGLFPQHDVQKRDG